MVKTGMMMVCIVIGLLASAAFAAGVDGQWRAEFDTQIGTQKYLFTFKADGEKLTGTAVAEVNGQKRETDLIEGRIAGDTLSFVEVLNFQGNALRIRYTGKASADAIAFTREVGDFAKEEFKATRPDNAAAAATAQPQNANGLPPEVRAAFGRPVVLGPDDKPAFADPPAGFDVERKDIPHGKLEMIQYESKTVGTTRKMQVYTPPGYSSERKYPVLYLLHGIGGDENEWVGACTPQIILDNLIADGKAVPMILVMPNGRAQKNDRPEGNIFAHAPAFAVFERDLLDDVIPAIQSRYSTYTDREHRALAGLSMGGGQALNFGLAHPDVFGWVGAFSPAPNTKRPAELLPDPATIKDLRLLWLSCGNKDGLINISQGVHAYLKEKGVPHVWNVDSNGHDPTTWKNNLYLFAERTFRTASQSASTQTSAFTPALQPPFNWVSTGPILNVKSTPTREMVAIKDPTVVRFNDRWHIYATTATKQGHWGMVYTSFADWKDADSAPQYYMDDNPNLRGYHCAPQVFYFRPHKKWYLIYQSQHPQYSTTDDISKPETWSAPQNFFPRQPKTVVQGWIDYWIICDETHAYLFFTDDHGRFYRSRTKMADFPNGFDDPVVVMHAPRAFDLFEGSCTYKIKGTGQYLTFIEALGQGGHRYFRGFISDRLDGEWRPLADTWDNPFAGISRVRFEEGVKPWTQSISHGELLREGYDETMTIDPANLVLLYQGMPTDTPRGLSYGKLPWSLGLLRRVAVAVAADAPATAPAAATTAPSISYPKTFTIEGNPFFKDDFTADPAPLVYKDTLYLYTGHDEAKGNQMYAMNDWFCFSTKDMKTWTAHGPLLSAKDFKWAVGDAWASQVVEKDGKFYWYCAVQHDKTQNGKAVGVAVADSPLGPFKDARGSALVTEGMTKGRPWDDIDPSVYIDTDGTAWMFWGNGTCYYAKLKPNMIELDGEIQKTNPLDRYVEGPWIYKRGDLYYLAYASMDKGSETLSYATSDKITGPWTNRGMIVSNAKNSFTTHPGIVEFKGQWYMLYHNGAIKRPVDGGGSFRRSVCIDYLYYGDDGLIKPIPQTLEGITVPPVKQ